MHHGPGPYAIYDPKGLLPDATISNAGQVGHRHAAGGPSGMKRYVGGTAFAGQDIEYFFSYSDNKPLMSQYVLDEHMMSGYENNNF
jgi:hypothetical protein